MKYRTLNALTVGWQSSSILKLEFCTYCILVTFVLHLPLLSILSNNVLDLQHFSTYSFYLPLFSTFLCCTLSIFSLISSISARTTFYLPLFSSIMCWTSITLKFAFRTFSCLCSPPHFVVFFQIICLIFSILSLSSARTTFSYSDRDAPSRGSALFFSFVITRASGTELRFRLRSFFSCVGNI